MTTCTELSDLMPSAVLGEREWTRSEAEHLAACADCAAEWELVSAMARLGAREDLRLNAGPLTSGVLQRVRAAHATERRRLWWSGAAAAAAVLLLVLVRPHRVTPPGVESASVATLALPGLGELSSPQLQLVLDGLDAALQDDGDDAESATLGGLDSIQLQQVLTSLEGT